jgi:hypothetical protein
VLAAAEGADDPQGLPEGPPTAPLVHPGGEDSAVVEPLAKAPRRLPAGRAFRAADDGWPIMVLNDLGPAHMHVRPNGEVCYDTVRSSVNKDGFIDFRMTCSSCGKKLNRTTRRGRGGQGRPFGLLVAWAAYNCHGSAMAHDYALCKPTESQRDTARAALFNCESLKAVLATDAFQEATPDERSDKSNGAPVVIP